MLNPKPDATRRSTTPEKRFKKRGDEVRIHIKRPDCLIPRESVRNNALSYDLFKSTSTNGIRTLHLHGTGLGSWSFRS